MILIFIQPVIIWILDLHLALFFNPDLISTVANQALYPSIELLNSYSSLFLIELLCLLSFLWFLEIHDIAYHNAIPLPLEIYFSCENINLDTINESMYIKCTVKDLSRAKISRTFQINFSIGIWKVTIEI